MRLFGDCVGRYIRVRVTIDVSTPLKPGLYVQFHSSDPQYVLPVLYEKLPDFCFHCGRLRHVFRECEEYVLVKVEDGSHPPLPFGNWLRAPTSGFMNQSEKNPATEFHSGDDGERLNESLLAQEKEMPGIDDAINSDVFHNVETLNSECADATVDGQYVMGSKNHERLDGKSLSNNVNDMAQVQDIARDLSPKVCGPIYKSKYNGDGPLKEKEGVHGLPSKDKTKGENTSAEATVININSQNIKNTSAPILEFSSSTAVRSSINHHSKLKKLACQAHLPQSSVPVQEGKKRFLESLMLSLRKMQNGYVWGCVGLKIHRYLLVLLVREILMGMSMKISWVLRMNRRVLCCSRADHNEDNGVECPRFGESSDIPST